MAAILQSDVHLVHSEVRKQLLKAVINAAVASGGGGISAGAAVSQTFNGGSHAGSRGNGWPEM